MTAPDPKKIRFSVVTNQKGAIGKRVWLDENGELQTKTNAALYNGRVEERTVDSLAEYMAMRQAAAPNECFVYGRWL